MQTLDPTETMAMTINRVVILSMSEVMISAHPSFQRAALVAMQETREDRLHAAVYAASGD
jgi:hypothetical protein